MIRLESELTGLNPAFNEDMLREIRMVMDRAATEGAKIAKRLAPVDTGYLINNIHIFRDYSPPSFEAGLVINLPYAVVMEQGRRPGKFPPRLPIERWVIRHRDSFGLTSTGEKFMQEVRRVAWLVSRKIARRGISGRFFFDKAADAIETAFGDRLADLGLAIKRAWEA